MVGDWTGVKSILARTELTSPELSLARVLVSVESNDPALPSHLRSARMELGRPLISATRDAYQRSYDSVVQLHLLHELELITEASHKPFEGVNGKVLSKEYAKGLKNALAERLGRTLPSFRVQEPILSMRRTAFGLT
jgi:serine/threonine-protein kinase ATR